MSFVTFIIITSYSKGEAGAIATLWSKCLFLWLFEALVQKGMFLCFHFGNPNFFELVSYTGYKFVILCLVMVAQLLGGLTASYVVMGVCGSAFSYFFYCTLRRHQTAHTLAEHARESSHSLNKRTFQLANCGI
mmetsp:Transcript_1811/g.2409  ORF Transcript_1811/g.2409 Transcript_1811/m.2409 type:complete len:133 (-) Transcript_1811:52-450(-)